MTPTDLDPAPSFLCCGCGDEAVSGPDDLCAGCRTENRCEWCGDLCDRKYCSPSCRRAAESDHA